MERIWNDNDYAIVIGLMHYQSGQGMRDLTSPHQDVFEFETWLDEHAFVPKENRKLFLSDSNYEPVKETIDDWLVDLKTKFDKEGPGRRLYFFFSGHGIGNDWKQTALLLPKWSKQRNNYALSSEGYRDSLIGAGMFKEIYFYMDCCRSRVPGITGAPPPWVCVEKAKLHTDFVAYYATEFDDSANEVEAADGSAHGFFTKILIRGLKGGAASRRTGKVTVGGLEDYIQYNLPRYAKEYDKMQTPRTLRYIDGHNPITDKVFPTEFDIKIIFRGATGTIVLEDENLQEIFKGPLSGSTESWDLKLKIGMYILRYVGDLNEQNFRSIFIDGTHLEIYY